MSSLSVVHLFIYHEVTLPPLQPLYRTWTAQESTLRRRRRPGSAFFAPRAAMRSFPLASSLPQACRRAPGVETPRPRPSRADARAASRPAPRVGVGARFGPAAGRRLSAPLSASDAQAGRRGGAILPARHDARRQARAPWTREHGLPTPARGQATERCVPIGAPR